MLPPVTDDDAEAISTLNETLAVAPQLVPIKQEELHTLPSLKVLALELDFKESKRVDEFGNEFRYRGKVRDTSPSRVARWAWDVFLVK